MAQRRSSKKSESKAEKPNFSLEGMEIKNVRELSDTVVAFSLCGRGLGLYNLRVVDGSKGAFISTPQSKGSDGKYYAQYALYLSDADEEKLIEQIYAKLDEADDI